jgi:cysteine rich repeat protein
MTRRRSSGGMYIWLVTALGLGLVWGTIVTSFPSQQELTAIDPPRAAAAPVPPPVTVPTLDLTIPMSLPMPSQDQSVVQQESAGARRSHADIPEETVIDPRSQQVAKLKCEAEIEQLCPGSSDDHARRQCIEQRMQRLAPPCQHLIRERFVKWKEERTRMIVACQEDMKRLCMSITPGSGNVLQCLQERAQDVSERCYQTLPKGKLYFKQ